MDGKYSFLGYFTFIFLFFIILFQGTAGIFYLDDFSNLSRLELIKNQPNGWLAFIFEDRIGPIGRPFSLLTFAIQNGSWPHKPFNFKIINLLIHIMNGAFIILICNKLFSNYFQKKIHYFNLSMLIGMLWTLAPIQFTNIFYVIQRMNLLSSTFLLAAIYIYIKFRISFSTFSLSRKIAILSLVAFIIMLSILSKENGILFFCYLLIIEHVIFYKEKSSKKYFLLLTTIVISIFFYIAISQYYSNSYQFRDFTLNERLLSQSRILYEYISLIIFPESSRLGLYHDNFSVSKSLFDPISTVYCLIFLVALLIIANITKRKAPLFSLGVFWFFIGHSLESTFLSLELYFEHRNYLPSFGIWIACSGLIIHNWNHIKSYRRLLAIALSLYIFFIIYSACYQSYLWGKPNLYAYQQAMDNPLSLRARYSLATAFMKSGEAKKAQDIIASHPLGNSDPEAIVRQWFIRCGEKTTDLMPELAINSEVNIQKMVISISMLQKILEKPYCSQPMRELAYDTLKNLAISFSEKEEFSLALGRYEYMANNPSQAIHYLQAAFKIKERPSTAQMLIELYDQLSLTKERNDYIQKYNRLIENKLLYRLIYEKHPL
jgi:hypothetical protein